MNGTELWVRRGSGDSYIYREVDLSGWTSATFSFDYLTTNNLEGGDRLRVDVSANGGSGWTTLESFQNDSSGNRNYDISSYIASNTQIRLYADAGLTSGEYFIFDNIQVQAN